MSAPNTDPDDQKQHHHAPLSGMKAVIGFVLILILGMVVYLSGPFEGPTRTPAPAETSGSTAGN